MKPKQIKNKPVYRIYFRAGPEILDFDSYQPHNYFLTDCRAIGFYDDEILYAAYFKRL